MDSIDIRIGTEEDSHAIIQFASSLSEDPFSSKDRWMKVVNDDSIHPLVALYNQNIVGKIQARLLDDIGWLEEAQVSPQFRKLGLAHTLVDAAMDWLISKGVEQIRTVVDSDNMAARKILERHHFQPKFLTINPSVKISEDDANPNRTADFALVLDEQLHDQYKTAVDKLVGGNIMIDGYYLPFTRQLLNDLIADRRVYTNASHSILLVVSYHNLPSEVHGFLIGKTKEDYVMGAHALRGFAGREMATLAICHAPSRREAVIGLAQEEFVWNQPHTIIIYGRDSWQERQEDHSSGNAK